MTNTDFSLPKGTHTVILGVGDMNGIMRGKRIPNTHWESICESGCSVSAALFAMDMTCDIWDGTYVNFDNGFPDMHIMPMTKPVTLPWEEGVAICFGRAIDKDHNIVPIDPREALVRQVERAKKMGFEVQTGTELEFYLLDPETGLPTVEGNQVYGLGRAARMEHVIGPIRRQINECGIPIEQSNPEFAPGQVEVNVRYDEALLSADRVVLFKSLVRQLGIIHGYTTSFMPKPFIDQSGSGFHTHYSLWKDGKNVFSDGGKINQLGKYFIGGLQKRMIEMSYCSSTNVNGYRRRQPDTMCPTNIAWGYDNRTVALRVLEGSEKAVRIEKRDAGADANPYLLLAADIAAGLDGIEQKIEPSEPTTTSAYKDDSIPKLPTDLASAVALAKGSKWLEDVIGTDLLSVQIQQSERELEFFANQVTQVERDRYLRNL